MRLFKTLVNAALAIIVTLMLAWLWGHITLSGRETDLLVALGDRLGMYGEEQIEDLYISITLAVSFVTSVLLVYLLNRIYTWHRHRNVE